MDKYEPNEEVLKKVAEEMPEAVKTQIMLEKIANKDASDYRMVVIKENGETHVDLTGPPNETMAAGAMLNSGVATIGAAQKMLGVSIDDLLVYIRETLKLSTIKKGD